MANKMVISFSSGSQNILLYEVMSPNILNPINLKIHINRSWTIIANSRPNIARDITKNMIDGSFFLVTKKTITFNIHTNLFKSTSSWKNILNKLNE